MDRDNVKICVDCSHHKREDGKIFCSKFGHETDANDSCADFNRNKKGLSRYIGTVVAERERVASRANSWLVGFVGVAVAILAIGTILSIKFETYGYIYLYLSLAVVLIVAGVTIFVKHRDRLRVLDMLMVRYETQCNEGDATSLQSAKITFDRVVSFLKNSGYSPDCVQREDGKQSIVIRYGDVYLNIYVDDDFVQVVCTFHQDENNNDGAFIQSFLLASNNVMQKMHCVQTYMDKDSYIYMCSGYISTVEELERRLPTLMSIMNESIALHRQFVREYLGEIKQIKDEAQYAKDRQIVN